MTKRLLTVSSLTASNRQEFPFIRLRGKWLQKLGFQIGQKDYRRRKRRSINIKRFLKEG